MPKEIAAPEGRRERKRRETRKRIVEAATKLFLERGYDATTMNDIADTADVSRRSLFDYFATKEDVLFANQEDFIPALVEEMQQRPKSEPWPILVEHAVTRAVVAAATPEAFAIEALVQQTPSLQMRQQHKHVRLEQAIAQALTERSASSAGAQRATLLAAVVVAQFRIATATPASARLGQGVHKSVSQDFRKLWQSLRELGEAGLAARPRAARPTKKTPKRTGQL